MEWFPETVNKQAWRQPIVIVNEQLSPVFYSWPPHISYRVACLWTSDLDYVPFLSLAWEIFHLLVWFVKTQANPSPFLTPIIPTSRKGSLPSPDPHSSVICAGSLTINLFSRPLKWCIRLAQWTAFFIPPRQLSECGPRVAWSLMPITHWCQAIFDEISPGVEHAVEIKWDWVVRGRNACFQVRCNGHPSMSVRNNRQLQQRVLLFYFPPLHCESLQDKNHTLPPLYLSSAWPSAWHAE